MYNLKIIVSAVRPGRRGLIMGRWITEVAKQHGAFDVELVDLLTVNLPLMNERHHPRLRKYEHNHTRRWSEKIEAADAFIFVTDEDDFNYPAPLRNALEYLFLEWGCKPAGIVSYGKVSDGTRAANSLKSDLTSFKLVPLPEMVNFSFLNQEITEKEELTANDVSKKAATDMLKELARWSKGLKVIREQSTQTQPILMKKTVTMLRENAGTA